MKDKIVTHYSVLKIDNVSYSVRVNHIRYDVIFAHLMEKLWEVKVFVEGELFIEENIQNLVYPTYTTVIKCINQTAGI